MKRISKLILSLFMAGAILFSTSTAYSEDMSTWKERFLKLYDQVITNGQTNGYLSTNQITEGFGIPYHAVESLYIDDQVDNGHLTTSTDLAWLVSVAGMKDKLVGSGDLAKAWNTLEVAIPADQAGFMNKSEPSVIYRDEWEKPEDYPQEMLSGNTGLNPIHKFFTSAYQSNNGLYLMHRLVDTDNTYGFGSNPRPIFINTFRRGPGESIWETIPHPAIEELKYGTARGIEGVFTTEANVSKQWRYENDPRAESRAIAAIYEANKWGVGNDSVTVLAAMMGDQLRNNFFDTYYKEIGCNNKNSRSAGYNSAHYLLGASTAWGGAIDGSWTWQTGCSHVKFEYQNPLLAYALLYDNDLKSGMKAVDAAKDYQQMLERQLEFYEWIQTCDGLLSPGATNSWNGRYEERPNEINEFYKLAYNNRSGEDSVGYRSFSAQTQAIFPLAQLLYYAQQDGNTDIADRCKVVLEKWIAWALENVSLTVNGYSIPAKLEFSVQPDTWTGEPSENTNSHAKVTDYSESDFGTACQLSTILLYYAKSQGVETANLSQGTSDIANLGDMALYNALGLMDRVWNQHWNSEGTPGMEDTTLHPDYVRLFEQDVWVPQSYGSATLPTGAVLANGADFLSLRPFLKEDLDYADLLIDYEDNQEIDSTDFHYHVFEDQCKAMQAFAVADILYPDLPTDVSFLSEIQYSDSAASVRVSRLCGYADDSTALMFFASYNSQGQMLAVVAGDYSQEIWEATLDKNQNTQTFKVFMLEAQGYKPYLVIPSSYD